MEKAILCLALGLAGAGWFSSEVSVSLFPGSPSGAPAAIQSDGSVAAFWEQFQAAVMAGDKAKVAALSRFPISRGYGIRSIRTKAQFMKRYRDLFFSETDAGQCFPKVKPVKDIKRPNEFSVICPFARDSSGEEPFVYTFTRTRAGWKFVGFENINE